MTLELTLEDWVENMRACGYNMDQKLRNQIEAEKEHRLVRRLEKLEIRFARERQREEEDRARRNRYWDTIYRVERMYERLFEATMGISLIDKPDEPPVDDAWRRLHQTGFHIEGMLRNRLHPPPTEIEDRRCA